MVVSRVIRYCIGIGALGEMSWYVFRPYFQQTTTWLVVLLILAVCFTLLTLSNRYWLAVDETFRASLHESVNARLYAKSRGFSLLLILCVYTLFLGLVARTNGWLK